jgi:hypothetical protein
MLDGLSWRISGASAPKAEEGTLAWLLDLPPLLGEGEILEPADSRPVEARVS